MDPVISIVFEQSVVFCDYCDIPQIFDGTMCMCEACSILLSPAGMFSVYLLLGLIVQTAHCVHISGSFFSMSSLILYIVTKFWWPNLLKLRPRLVAIRYTESTQVMQR